MPSLSFYKFEPAPGQQHLVLHIGKRGIGIEETAEYVPSDSLFAALVAQAALLEGATTALPDFAQAFLGDDPPLLHSSVFPRIGELLLMPRPALEVRMDATDQREAIGKGFKKLRYLSPKLFTMVCESQDVGDVPLLKLQYGTVWVSQAEATELPALWRQGPNESPLAWQQRVAQLNLWDIEQIPHVAVDRTSNQSVYYEVGRTTFAPGCGLGLLVEFRDETFRPRFEHVLSLLGEAGLGGKRSSGYGAFSLIQAAQPLASPQFGDADRVLTLSRYIPRRDEIGLLQDERAAYNIVAVEGWLLSPTLPPQRHQRINCLTEGSVLALDGAAPLGRIVDVSPAPAQQAHPILRSGLALTIPIRRKSDAT